MGLFRYIFITYCFWCYWRCRPQCLQHPSKHYARPWRCWAYRNGNTSRTFGKNGFGRRTWEMELPAITARTDATRCYNCPHSYSVLRAASNCLSRIRSHSERKPICQGWAVTTKSASIAPRKV